MCPGRGGWKFMLTDAEMRVGICLVSGENCDYIDK